MKVGVIDIGSNSVRLMLWADGKTLYKKMKTTRLGEGLNFSPYLLPQACQRTAEAVKEFVEEALSDGAQEVAAFATAAVRSAKNPELFTDAVKKICPIEVEVISGEEEAAIGLAGALGTQDGGIIDVGGASTEVTVRSGGKVMYSHSAPIGTVRILDGAGRDLSRIREFIAQKLPEYGDFDCSSVKMYAVGGTATRLGAIKRGITQYIPTQIDGTPLSLAEVWGYADKLTSMPVEEIRSTTICTKSADLIGGGAALLASVMEKFKVKKITVSDGDNLEGYAITRFGAGN